VAGCGPGSPRGWDVRARLKDIEQVVGSYTKAVVINSPCNPSGAVYPAELVAEIVEFCERRGLYLIVDDIYHRLLFDGRKPVNCYDFAKDKTEKSRLVLINGVSKQYAMTGFRIGWAVANRKLIEVMTAIQGHQTSGPSAVTQYAAVAPSTGSRPRWRACARPWRTTATC